MSRVLSDTMPPYVEPVATERRHLTAAFYANSVAAYLGEPDVVYAPLANPRGYTLAPEQPFAWRLQLPVLRAAIKELVARSSAVPAACNGLEFDIPRLGPRVDAVLVTSTCVAPIVFTEGAKKLQRLNYD